jgi:hypothetical protein
VDFLSGLQGALLFMGGVVATGVIGYHVLEGYTWVEALYKMLFHPAPGARIESGDSLIALAEAPQLKKIEQQVRRGT